MAYRLTAQAADRVLRFALVEGENLVGSGADCTVRLRHPTVSRRHARLEVEGDIVRLTDLASSNGTRFDGHRLERSVELPAGAVFELGSVRAMLERVDDADLEAAVELPPPPSPATAGDREDSTIGPASLERFTLVELPRLLARLAGGAGEVELAQAVGAALLAALPCRRVEVLDRRRRGLLFDGGDGTQPVSPATVEAPAGADLVLLVELLSNAIATRYAPLVQAGADLIRAAGRGSAPRPLPVTAAVAPAPPDPPSLAPAVQEIYQRAARVARSGISVLIRGESGTGKELLARYLHAASARAERPLVVLNCAALPRDLLEAELFGVERGVATGVDARAGKFEAAHGGTLFLDEVGDMAPETQARILRVLEAGEVHRVGGHTAHPADVRVLAATNRDLEVLLADGRFRRDLFHRIADWVVELPPLRARRVDIPNLAAHFLARAAAARGGHPAGISRAAVAALQAYPWPGNIRELEKEIGRAALFLEDGELLDTSALGPAVVRAAAAPADETLRGVRERAEREHIRRVLEDCGGSVPAAATRLDVGVSTLYARMKALAIE